MNTSADVDGDGSFPIVEPIDEMVGASQSVVASPEISEFRGATASRSVRWSALAVIGKQAFQLLCALTLARILGPQTYGVISAAMIYVTISALLLDQGLTAALIQRRELSSGAPGAAVTLNLIGGIVLAIATWLLAGDLAGFLHTPALIEMLKVLGAGLLLKAAAITPRAMLSRHLRFKPIAVADISGSFVGAIAGVTAAVLGAGYHALLYQTLITDLIVAVLLMVAARGPRPNMRMRELVELVPFGARIFATTGIAYVSRNTDNILVARYLGALSLSYYAMAYRVLVIPVQMLGQAVSRTLFPVLSRLAGQRDAVARTLIVATELLAIVALPLMTFVSCAAHELIDLGLGDRWAPTAPVVSVLALAGARETIFYVTPNLMMAMDRSQLNLRFELVSTAVQVVGIVIGLQFGVLGVAVGYALAGCLLTPFILMIQRHLTGLTLHRQLMALWPAVHGSAWAAAAYMLITLTGLPNLAVLVLGGIAFALGYFMILRLFHRSVAAASVARLKTLRPGGRRRPRHARSAT